MSMGMIKEEEGEYKQRREEDGGGRMVWPVRKEMKGGRREAHKRGEVQSEIGRR